MVTDEHNGAFWPPEVVLQMVLDASGLAHAGCGDDYLGAIVEVDGAGFVAGDCELEPMEGDGIAPVLKPAPMASSSK